MVTRLRTRYQRGTNRVTAARAGDLALLGGLVALIAAGAAAGAVVQDVTAGRGATGLDRAVLEWFVRHREPWLTTVLKVVTALGSSAVLIPVVVLVAGWWWRRRRTARPIAMLGASYLGAVLLSQSVKTIVGRARPPASLAVAHYSGRAFPSGHATLAVAGWGAIAALAAARPSWRAKVAPWAGAVLAAALIGVSRLYLGAHWLSDVLAGWVLGALWLVVVLLAVGTGDEPSVTDTSDRAPAM